MARLNLNDDKLRPRRPQPGHLPTTSGDGIFDPPLGPRHALRVHSTGIGMSVGSVGDSCDNALAETVIGLFKTEVVKHLGPRKTKGRLECETMKWVH